MGQIKILLLDGTEMRMLRWRVEGEMDEGERGRKERWAEGDREIGRGEKGEGRREGESMEDASERTPNDRNSMQGPEIGKMMKKMSTGFSSSR